MTMRLYISALIAVAACGGCVTHRMSNATAERAGIATGFLNKSLKVDGKERGYVVYVPRAYDPGKKWPLIVFLHGAGERGDDGLIQSDVGLGRAIRQNPDRFPCVVVMPQCPGRVWWDEAADEIELAYQKTVKEYSIDSSRTYLTGLSMGGYGTWVYGAQHIDRYAALAPICGGGKPEDAATLAKVPIWAFHGAVDEVVKPDESRKMVEAVKAAGGKVKYTEYPDLHHNSWDATYGDAEVIKWLLSQKR
ncbi:MAG: dienelactone hydrolase family protein [Candidatus Hydrogenedentes bacterium]|nr:dienelactone hydrolase family protein [Candidatus Hydrogenedentota bacterium]